SYFECYETIELLSSLRVGQAARSAALDPALRFAEVAEHLEGTHAIAPPEPVHPGDAEAEVAPHHDRPPRGRIEDRREGGEGPHSLRGEAIVRNLRAAKVEEDGEIRLDRGSGREVMVKVEELRGRDFVRGRDPDVLPFSVDLVVEGHEGCGSPFRQANRQPSRLLGLAGTMRRGRSREPSTPASRSGCAARPSVERRSAGMVESRRAS